jgi:hypothetical protein
MCTHWVLAVQEKPFSRAQRDRRFVAFDGVTTPGNAECNDVEAEGPTSLTMPLMAIANKATLKVDHCGTPFSGDNEQTKHCQHESENGDPGGSLKE